MPENVTSLAECRRQKRRQATIAFLEAERLKFTSGVPSAIKITTEIVGPHRQNYADGKVAVWDNNVPGLGHLLKMTFPDGTVIEREPEESAFTVKLVRAGRSKRTGRKLPPTILSIN